MPRQWQTPKRELAARVEGGTTETQTRFVNVKTVPQRSGGEFGALGAKESGIPVEKDTQSDSGFGGSEVVGHDVPERVLG